MTKTSQVFRVPMSGPSDISGVKELIDRGYVAVEDIVAILGKTEGNGCVNDFTRGYSTFAFQVMLAEVLGVSRDLGKTSA
jgi:cyanuric acid amidohydrolase